MIYKVTRTDGTIAFVKGAKNRYAAMQASMEGDGYTAKPAKADEVIGIDPDDIIDASKKSDDPAA